MINMWGYRHVNYLTREEYFHDVYIKSPWCTPQISYNFTCQLYFNKGKKNYFCKKWSIIDSQEVARVEEDCQEPVAQFPPRLILHNYGAVSNAGIWHCCGVWV